MSRSHFRLAERPANFSASTRSARSRAYPFPLSMAVRASAASENQINQLIKCALDCARAWGRCASHFLSSVMFVPLRAGYDIANQGVKSYQVAEIGGRASSDRAIGVDHDSAAAKKLWAPAVPGPDSVPPPPLPSWMTAWMLSTIKTVMQLRKQKPILRGQAKCH